MRNESARRYILRAFEASGRQLLVYRAYDRGNAPHPYGSAHDDCPEEGASRGEVQEGITLGIDSGSSTTKAVVMKDNKIIGTGWQPTTEVLKCAREVVEHALTEAGMKIEDVQAIGTTGYGRFLVGKDFNADLVQEELTVNSKGAVYLANKQHGPATVIDIGGMDNKAITVMDGIPGTFTMGGICAGASGRFLEMTAKRLGVDITELGPLAMKGMGGRVPMNSYCIVFGTQSLVNALAAGSTRRGRGGSRLPQCRRTGLRAAAPGSGHQGARDYGRRHLAYRGAGARDGRTPQNKNRRPAALAVHRCGRFGAAGIRVY